MNAFADMLALISADVKRRGGILKLHVNAAEMPMAGGLDTYDYLWVGEGLGQADALRELTKNHTPYLVPCIDMGFAATENDDEPYLQSIPYMQFPVSMGGHIFTGERGFVPGVNYKDDFWLKRCKDTYAQYQAESVETAHLQCVGRRTRQSQRPPDLCPLAEALQAPGGRRNAIEHIAHRDIDGHTRKDILDARSKLDRHALKDGPRYMLEDRQRCIGRTLAALHTHRQATAMRDRGEQIEVRLTAHGYGIETHRSRQLKQVLHEAFCAELA